MPTGRPSSAGTSNDSSARTRRINSAPAAAGQASLSVIFQAICRIEAPLINADSSSEGSIEQDAGDHQRYEREREEQLLERRIGTLVHPGERGAEAERERSGAGRELHRV